jgi:hypothetical protein
MTALAYNTKTAAATLALAAALLLAPRPSAAAPSPQKGSSPSEVRIALVIGNGAYPNVPLKNPANDAKDIAAALKKLGFSVSLVVDGDMAAMSRAIRDFGAAIKRPDAVALFYYSGHGVQYRGANYLIPAKSDIQDPDELAFSAVNAEQVYAKMESAGDKVNIVVLDACRNNPFPGSERASERGLAVVGTVQPPQSLIVYATAPGKTAQDGGDRNGVFSAALLKHVADPGLDVELMFRSVRDEVIAATDGAQVPWTNSSISGKGFVFVPKKDEPAAVPAKAAAPAAAAVPTKGRGVLSVTSEPNGLKVSIDDAEAIETPFKLSLAPGSHSVELEAGSSGGRYFSGEKKRWIEVAAGAETALPFAPEPANGSLRFRLVPPGYSVSVNGEPVGVTPLSEIPVQAGLLSVRFEREGAKSVEMPCGLQPGETASIEWGSGPDTAVELARSTIKLEAKPDSWAEVEPLLEPKRSSFMGDEAYGIKAFYLCRDDKYLYIRVDFRATNPLDKKPKGMGRGIVLQLRSWIEAEKKDFSIGIQYNRDMNKIESVLGSYDGQTRKWTKLAENAASIRQGKDMLVARIDWSWIEKRCSHVGRLIVLLANIDDSWQWVGRREIETPFIDFTK